MTDDEPRMSQPARWLIRDDAESLCLQVELGAGYAITLTTREGEPPSIRLWQGNGERPFDEQIRRAGFRAWLDEMAFAQE